MRYTGSNDASQSLDSGSTAVESASDLESLSASLNSRLQHFLDSKPSTELLQNVQDQTRTCLRVCREALTRYNLAQLSLSYNGGKDCLVLLICYLAALYQHFRPPNNINEDTVRKFGTRGPDFVHDERHNLPAILKSIYIQPAHPFQEVDAFVRESSSQYRLKLASSQKPMKEAFAEYLRQEPEIKAIFVGTRRTDPHGQALTHFDETDRGWPKFMRIHPVIDWRYQEIWAFIRHLDIPYCSLYDRGYTSLGGTTDTRPNPALHVSTRNESMETSDEHYRPAFELLEDDEERLGRE